MSQVLVLQDPVSLAFSLGNVADRIMEMARKYKARSGLTPRAVALNPTEYENLNKEAQSTAQWGEIVRLETVNGMDIIVTDSVPVGQIYIGRDDLSFKLPKGPIAMKRGTIKVFHMNELKVVTSYKGEETLDLFDFDELRDFMEHVEATLPRRIQRKRTKGWKMPPHSKYVGRPTKYGNEYRLPKDPHPDDYEIAVMIYESKLRKGELPFTRADVKRELAGWNLACWCPLDRACHRDVLLKIANSDE